jgi:class 3 adenylate cyclase
VTIRVLGLHHHALRSGPDPLALGRLREFYSDVLGLPCTAPAPGEGAGRDSPLDIDLGPQGRVQLDPAGPLLSLLVADIGAARAELDRLGIASRRIAEPGAEPVLRLRDPAGNLIELRTPTAAAAAAAAERHEPAPADSLPTDATGRYTRVRSAVMFADMRGFTRISERLSPTEVVPLLNEYFDLLTGIATEHGGTVFNMAGDGLMVGFGVPREEADASHRAVETAREMLARFDGLASQWKRRHDVETGLGIGINTGEVIAGNVGSARFMSYTIVGDTVNVASRLSQRARAGEALFSSEVRRSLGSALRSVPVVELPALQLRGRAAPVEIFCLPASDRLDLRPDVDRE